jgi:hypothetical protein
MIRFPRSVAIWPASSPRFTVLYLHDHRLRIPEPGDAPIRELRERSISVLAPDGGPSWWTDRPCPAFSPTRTAERALLELADELPHPIGLFGGEAAVRIGLKHPRRFPVVATWDGAFDFHDLHGTGTSLDELFERREQARQHTAVLQVRTPEFPPHIWFGCPADSEWYRGNDRLHEKLSALGIGHEFVVRDECPTAEIVQLFSNGLERESRRLL